MTHEPSSGPGPEDQNEEAGPTPPPPPPPSAAPPPPAYGEYGAASVPPPPPGGGGYYDPGFNAPYSAGTAISYGFEKFKANAGPWILAMVILVAVSIALGVASVPFSRSPVADPESLGDVFGPLFSPVEIVINLVSMVIGYMFQALMIRGALDETEGAKFEISSAFSRLNIVPVVLLGLLLSVGTTIGLFLCILPGLAFAFFTVFSLPILIDRKVGPIEAIAESFRIVSGNLGNAFVTVLLVIGIIIVATILCCLPLIVAVPITQIAVVYAYKKFTNQAVA